MNTMSGDRQFPEAYFLTWHTFGTWLHGDARASVDRDNNRFSTPFLSPDDDRRRGVELRMSADALRLNDAMRESIQATAIEVAQFRQWRMLAIPNRF